MLEKSMEFHSAFVRYGEVAGGDDECAVASIRGDYAGIGVLS